MCSDALTKKRVGGKNMMMEVLEADEKPAQLRCIMSGLRRKICVRVWAMVWFRIWV
jgi:hypothetical protein